MVRDDGDANVVKVHALGTHQLVGELGRRAAYFNTLYSHMKYTLRGIKAEIRGVFFFVPGGLTHSSDFTKFY